MLSFLVGVAILLIFVIGYSITLFRKGRHVQTDVGGNEEMKKLGLECASHMMRREDAEFRGHSSDPFSDDCSLGSCCSCETECADSSKK